MRTPQQIADKWARNAAAAGQSYEEGINAVQEAPTHKAAAAVDRYVAGVNRAAADGKFQAGLMRVTLAAWKNAAISKGKNRLQSGVTAAKDKMQSFLAEFLPYVEQVKQSLPPRGDFAQNMARMNANAEALHNFRRRS